MTEGGVPEDEISAVDKNTIATDTVDANKNVDADDNLPSDNDGDSPASPTKLVSRNYLDKMKVIYLKAILKAGVLSIAGNKSDLKLILKKESSAGI